MHDHDVEPTFDMEQKPGLRSNHEIVPASRTSFEEMQEEKSSVKQKGGSPQDEQEMARMGKRQELRRNFKLVGIIGFVTILQSTWEGTLLANYYGLFNGGTGGVIWCTIAVWLFMLCMIASLGELASMAPTAGGQYHWVSEFAPRRYQKALSYVVGWYCCLGWIAGIPSCGLQLAGILEGMILIANPDANLGSLWQTTLIVFAFIILTVSFNIFFAHHLPLAEGMILFVHVFGFFAFLLVLWIMPEHVPADTVFLTFNNGGGWSTQGLACLVGLTTPIWCFIGPDAGAHMSEELKDASLQLPKAMIWATFANGVMGITMLISFCFCIQDLDSILNGDGDFPVISIIYNATGSQAGTLVLGSVLVILLFFSTVTTIASASRQIWAFSRDGGLPYSSWIQWVHPSWDIPVNSLIFCLVISLLLSAINFGSNVALNAILSISNAALIFSYIISVGCIRLKRLRGEPLLPRRWSLGRWGGLINDITLAFLAVAFIFSFFPIAPSVGDDAWAADFNWSIIIFVGTAVIALTYYVVGGSQKYVAPVTLVKQE